MEFLSGLLSKAVLPPASPAVTHALQFTPLVGLCGGAVLGIAAATKWALTGRVLGISGILKGFIAGDARGWRVAFLSGLLGAGVVAGAINPGAFETLSASYTVERAALGGLLVGLGAAMGNGCTSGHGICGNARLSPRSAVYTLTFMAAGALSATATGAAAALGVAASKAPLTVSLTDAVAHQGGLLLATAVLAAGAVTALARSSASQRVSSLVTEFVTGGLFAWGLAYTGMVRPSKVAAFLSPGYAGFDPTLMFVMGGALLVALPAFQWCARDASAPKAPLCGGAWPALLRDVDSRLITGGVLFGAGWGLSGMCPGPALVALVATLHPAPQVAAYVAAMLVGMALEKVTSKGVSAQPPRHKAA